MAKVYDISQGSHESLTTFLEMVRDAFWKYTSTDSESPEAETAAVLPFISKVAPVIKRKLQGVERKGVGEETKGFNDSGREGT